MKRLILILATVLSGTAAQAQNLFAPVVVVNGAAITRFEVDQRETFLRVLRSPGDLASEAEKALINERVQVLAAERVGVTISPEQLAQGMTEFASRANLTTEQFIAALGQEGIAPETFRDFVRHGLMWREYVQARFGPQARVTEAEVDRALAQAATETGARVSLAEIVLPAGPDRLAESNALAAQLKDNIRTNAAFADAARQFSIAGSRANGGVINPLDLGSLPPPIAQILLTLSPGEVSAPVPVGEGAIAVFQLRGLTELTPRLRSDLTVDYAQYAIAGGLTPEAQAKAAQISAEITSCDDLYPLARAENPEALTRTTSALSSVPSDIRLELAKMDPGETSALLTRNSGQTLLLVMLCNRTPPQDDESRERTRVQLFNQRMTSLANGYLEALKADAIISRP